MVITVQSTAPNPQFVCPTNASHGQCDFISEYWLTVSGGRSGNAPAERKETRTQLCQVCNYQVPHGEDFFHCAKDDCGLVICQTCAATNRYSQLVKQRGDGAWKHGLSMPTLDSCCFFWCQVAQTHHSLHHGLSPEGAAPNWEKDCNRCVLPTIVCLVDIASAGCLNALPLCNMLGLIETRYGLQPSSCCSKWLPSYLCRCCVLQQINNELTAYNCPPGGVCTPVPNQPPRPPLIPFVGGGTLYNNHHPPYPDAAV